MIPAVSFALINPPPRFPNPIRAAATGPASGKLRLVWSPRGGPLKRVKSLLPPLPFRAVACRRIHHNKFSGVKIWDARGSLENCDIFANMIDPL